jgi:hypothetical protein
MYAAQQLHLGMVTSLTNIYSVGNIFIASVTVDVTKINRQKNLVVIANCYPSYQLGLCYEAYSESKYRFTVKKIEYGYV